MREIKFRAYDGEKMYDAMPIIDFKVCGINGIALMQYTGRKDKNGKESYFDDVLKWRDSTFQIIWDDECATTMLKRISGTDGMKEIPAHNIKDSEVIGNIYENKELLEG